MKRKDLTGSKYGHLTVKQMIYKYNGGRRTFCECLCECGNICYVEASKLKSRNNPSCGCMSKYYRTIHNRSDETGKKFNMLTIQKIDYSNRPSMAYCRCDCGNYKWIAKADIISGHTKSCGCLQKTKTSEANVKDYSGVVAPNGVKFLQKVRMNEHGTWIYKCQCPLCDNQFEAIPARVFSNHNTSCGCNRKSSGERIVSYILDKNHIKYKTQHIFDDCIDKNPLPFDFAIQDDNDKIVALIEYDGEQHYRPVDLFGGEKAFENRRKHDRIKDNYCKSHNLTLCRIVQNKDIEEIEKTILDILNP